MNGYTIKNICELTGKSERTIRRYMEPINQDLGQLVGKQVYYSAEEVITILDGNCPIPDQIREAMLPQAPTSSEIVKSEVVEAELIDLPPLDLEIAEKDIQPVNHALEQYGQYSQQAKDKLAKALENRLVSGIEEIILEQDQIIAQVRAKAMGEGFRATKEEEKS